MKSSLISPIDYVLYMLEIISEEGREQHPKSRFKNQKGHNSGCIHLPANLVY